MTEAFDDRGEQFGEIRLNDCLSAMSGRPAEVLAASTLAAVREHAGDHPQSDDITILAVRRT